MSMGEAGARILDAAKSCCEQWGFEKVTVDDIAQASGVSRATLYRLFPGGKDVLFEAMRVRERAEFFGVLAAEVAEVETSRSWSSGSSSLRPVSCATTSTSL